MKEEVVGTVDAQVDAGSGVNNLDEVKDGSSGDCIKNRNGVGRVVINTVLDKKSGAVNH